MFLLHALQKNVMILLTHAVRLLIPSLLPKITKNII